MNIKNFIEEFKYANRGASNVTKVIYLLVILYFGSRIITRLISDPFILLMIGILLISVMLHEIAHGVAANRNGDTTAKDRGRLSLNPIVHLDPIGTLLPIILIASGASFVIGWAKPVPVNYSRIRDKKWGLFQVAIAGVLVNFILALVGATLIKFLPLETMPNVFYRGISYLVRINLVLGIFNLIPIPPLDGSKVVATLGGRGVKDILYKVEPYGMFIVMGLAYFGILGMIIGPFYNVAINLLNYYIGL